MNKEALKNKIAEILNVSTSEKDLAFEMMLKKLSEILNFDEAINIPEVGIFSLKKEPLLREERSEKAGLSLKRNLVFLPDEKDSTAASKSMYLSFNLDNTSRDYLEFDENVFSISVGKPIVSATGIQSGTPNGDNPERMLATLEEKVQKLVANTEKISNYDIWNEFASKEKSNKNEDIVVNDASADEDLKQMVSENVENEVMAELEPEQESNDRHELNEDSELVNESAEEVSQEKNDSQNLDDENELVDASIEEEADPEEEQSSNAGDSESDDKEGEEINWDWGDELKEELEADASKTSDESETKEEVSQSITNSEKKERKPAELFESVDSTSDEPEEEEKVESEDDADVSNSEDASGTKTVEYSPDDFEKEQPKESKIDLIKKKLGFGKTFWILVGAFVFVGIIGIYFLFFTGGNKSAEIKNNVVPDTLIHKRLKPIVNNTIKKNTADNISESKTKEEKPSMENSNSAKQKNVKHTAEKNTENKREITDNSSSLYRTFPNEKQVRNLIFLQNGEYSVQVSSRRNKVRAEQYVKKLRNIGYDAFIVKTYLSQLKSTWYRVRIGFFKSEKEAVNFRIKNKF